ncbi:hypothetical protein SASPL_132926 [Salvia splendens]|uniref:Uncharacterized protein n=1 Tax=Salvia splendens TaxID=180675 RepID=A0A8X8X2U9_SALSN|nr:hypothetical protein SASPL_132926 [Salvia splendens]
MDENSCDSTVRPQKFSTTLTTEHLYQKVQLRYRIFPELDTKIGAKLLGNGNLSGTHRVRAQSAQVEWGCTALQTPEKMDVDFEEENLRSLQIEEDEGPIRPSSRIRRRIRIESEVSRPNTAQLADTPRIRIDGVSVAYRYRIRIRYVIRQQGGVSVLYRLSLI